MDLLIPTPFHIVQLALELKKLAEMVKENKDEFRKIGIRAQHAGELLVKIEERRPEMIRDPTMKTVLVETKNSIEIARMLVDTQENKGILPSCIQAKKVARHLRMARDDIDSNILLVLAAIMISDEGQQQQPRDFNTVMKIPDEERKQVRNLVNISTESLDKERERVRDLLNKATEAPDSELQQVRDLVNKATEILANMKIHDGELQQHARYAYAPCHPHPRPQPQGAGMPVSPGASHLEHHDSRTEVTGEIIRATIPAAAARAGTADFKRFKFDELAGATHNFSSAKRIWSAGSSTIYKGRFRGQEVLVKKFNCSPTATIHQGFMDLAVLDHKNVIRYKGYCIEEKAILVYEDMPNGRLDTFINYFHLLPRNEREELPLDWSSCFQVIDGIAKGIAYIHEKFMPWGDPFSGGLKPSDILMDSDWIPKITNIGISRVIEKSAEATAVQKLVQIGYRAPEYVGSGVPSVESDIYSFGLIVLEIITGMNFSQEGQKVNVESLINQAWDWYKKLKEKALKDPMLSSYLRRIRRCIRLAANCIKEEPEDRPTMKAVLCIINDRIVQEPAPT